MSSSDSEAKQFAAARQRPLTTVVLAASVDGKISDVGRSHPTFGSKHDFDHLEQQVAAADAVLFGSATLRAGGTAMRVVNPARIEQRVRDGKPEQPVQIVCTRTGDLDPALPFFRQPIPRYLLTTLEGAARWQDRMGFDRVLSAQTKEGQIDWHRVLNELYQAGVSRIAVLGGGEVVAALLEADLLDELHLTVCPILLGGKDAPTPVAGAGFLQDCAPRLELVGVKQIDGELFLHYRVLHRQD
ncbi:RibD family protein [Altericista sp. CCNU0014]|uniref:RibD family protein n=1 Tax=Altericista sp. CCNU0014 TaxID=3082949 RepID=UPI00384DF71C